MNNYKHGIVDTDSHIVLRKGQKIRVMYERDGCYMVKPYISEVEQIIEKKFVILVDNNSTSV